MRCSLLPVQENKIGLGVCVCSEAAPTGLDHVNIFLLLG